MVSVQCPQRDGLIHRETPGTVVRVCPALKRQITVLIPGKTAHFLLEVTNLKATEAS